MKNYSRIICLLIALLVISCVAYGQKCKYDFQNKDEFTGKTSVGFRTVVTTASVLTLSTDGDNHQLTLHIAIPGVTEDFVSPGDTMMIALENSEPLIFVAEQMVSPTANATQTSVYTTLLIPYSITDWQLQKLSTCTPTAIRVFVNKNTKPLNFTVSTKKGETLSKNAICISAYQKSDFPIKKK